MITLPKSQVLSSTTFTAPPLEDQTLALPDLYDFHLTHSPNHPLFAFDEGGVTKTITWAEGVRAIHRAAYFINASVNYDGMNVTRPVVAVLAGTDTITYFCFLVGILRTGCTIFPISPRNGPHAVAHLLEKTGATHLFVSSEPAIQALSAAVMLQLSTPDSVKTSEMAVFEDLFPSDNSSENFRLFPSRMYDLDGPALILHSSGSTAFPKPIIRTHRGLLELARSPWFGEVDVCGLMFGCHAVPMFHGMGAYQISIAPSTGIVLAMFKPNRPATVPTPENSFEGAVATKTEILCCAPMFLEAWSRVPKYIGPLKQMRGVMIGGGPLNKDVGDGLAAQGVVILNIYSCTECGTLSKWIPAASPGLNWEFFEFSPHVQPTLMPYPDGTLEVIVKTHETLRPMTINTQVEGTDAYATSDLLLQHPTIPHLYKIFGRVDDQIMLSTGEKTNPGPLQTILCQDPKVQAAVIFGRERPFNGVIVAPRPEFAFDPTDDALLAKFRDDIWPTVERLNAFAPTHSRLFKEMILVESPSKPFAYTAKSTVRRALVISDYDPEIKTLYDTVTVSTLAAPAEWTESNVQEFVVGTIASVMNKSLDENDDFFEHGCDSLQATWIQNAIRVAISKTSSPAIASRLPTNFLYQHPTTASLSVYIWTIVDAVDAPDTDDLTTKVAQVRDMLNHYNANFPSRPTGRTVPGLSGEVVMLVGSTGGFGSSILHHLVHSPTVSQVYALNRKSLSGTSLQDRQEKALGWDETNILGRKKVVLLEADMSVPGFALDPAIFEQLRYTVTHIIHSAWRVDFNATLTSFEVNIRSVRNLVDFSLSSYLVKPPRLLFISSIAVFNRPKTRGIFVEAPVDDAEVPVGTGYGEAKWISEQILAAAARETDLRPTVVRLGQIAGNLDGYWNEREWFPLIVKSALSVKCLPKLNGAVSWIPSYDAAKALTEMLNADHPILHLAHPRPIPWSFVIDQIAQSLKVPVIPYAEWLTSLKDDLKDPSVSEVEHMRRNPALRLLKFFSDADLDEDREPLGVVRLGTTEAVRISATLADLQPLAHNNVTGWVKAWQTTGFVTA